MGIVKADNQKENGKNQSYDKNQDKITQRVSNHQWSQNQSKIKKIKTKSPKDNHQWSQNQPWSKL